MTVRRFSGASKPPGVLKEVMRVGFALDGCSPLARLLQRVRSCWRSHRGVKVVVPSSGLARSESCG